jgi:GMP synthase-like glutamine amidotransferase
MQKRLLIVKNVQREGAGLLETILKERQIDFDIADLDTGAEFPTPKNYQGIVVLGGPDSANAQTPKILKEIERVKEALQLQIPILAFVWAYRY